MRVHDAVVETLASHRVTTLFGLMGDANMLYITDFIIKNNGHFVAAVDERNATVMATGYASTTDQTGVATVTHGPGITHAITALVEAARARVPLVLITGETPPVHGYFQFIDLRAVADLVGAAYERVWKPETTSQDVARAFRRAHSERRPVILDVPADLLEVEAGPTIFSPQPEIFQAVKPDPGALDEALGLLVSAARPVIIAGRGAVNSGARNALVELADYLGAPLATSLLAKDYFRSHRLNLGICGTLSTPVASARIATSDCVIAFGASLNIFTADRGALLGKQRIIHVERDPSRLGTFTPVTVPVVADANVVAQAMLARLREFGQTPAKGNSNDLAQSLREYSPLDDYRDLSNGDTIDLRTAMITFDAVLPSGRNLVTDVGRSMTAPWRYIHVDDPRGFVQTCNFASIGLGLGAAVGVAVSRPDQPTVAVLGDGGFMQGSPELRTAVRHKLPLIVIVANDGAYGAEWRRLQDYGVDPNYSRSDWSDLSTLAESYGARGYTVRAVEEIEKLAPIFADLDGPVLVDVRIDAAVEVEA